MTGSRPLRPRLRAMRPEAFGADPSGARMERIRRSPNFADGVFQNPVAARNRPSGSMAEFAKIYFHREQRARRSPVRRFPSTRRPSRSWRSRPSAGCA